MAIGKMPTPEQVESLTVHLARLRLLGCTSATAHWDAAMQRTVVISMPGGYINIEYRIPHEYVEAACAVFTHGK